MFIQALKFSHKRFNKEPPGSGFLIKEPFATKKVTY